MKTISTIIAMLLLTLTLSAQSWKVNVFGGFNYSLDSNKQIGSKIEGKDKSKFEVKDVFVTYNSFDFGNFSASATLNCNEVQNVNLYSASLNYLTNPLNKISFGVSLGKLENPWYTKTNKFWSNYSIEKVATQKNAILPQTDLGLEGKINSKYFNANVNVSNAGNDSSKSLTGVLSITPNKNFTISGLYYKHQDYKVFGGALNFNGTNKKSGTVNTTAEYILTDNTVWKSTLISVYGEVQPKALGPVSLVAKYDTYKPNNDVEFKTNSLTFGFNYNFKVLYGVAGKFGLNFHNVSSTNLESHNEVSLHANFNY